MSPKAAVKKIKRTKKPSAEGAAETAVSVKEIWHLVDADNLVLGRLASRLAMILQGKHKPSYERHIRTGDNVVVINAAKVRVTGKKMDDKNYKFYSGYPSGNREVPLKKMIAEQPEYPLMHAVKGMLPKNSMGHKMLARLKIYGDANHPHKAQQPKELKIL